MCGCDTLCIKCESMMEKCEKCGCPCHCSDNKIFVKSCEECGCIGCSHKEVEVAIND